MPPELQSITSTPLGFRILARATLWSGPQPASSSTEKRTNSGFEAGQWARTLGDQKQEIGELRKPPPKIRRLKVPKPAFDFLDFDEAIRLEDAAVSHILGAVQLVLQTSGSYQELAEVTDRR